MYMTLCVYIYIPFTVYILNTPFAYFCVAYDINKYNNNYKYKTEK